MPNRAKGERLVRVAALVLIASLLTFSVPPIAQADPAAVSQAQSELDALKRLVDKLDADLSAADEDYNQASEQLKQTQAAQATTRAELAQAGQDLDAVRQRLMDRLVEIYKNGSSGMLEVLLGATDFSDLIDRFEKLGRVSAQDSALVKQVEDYVARVANRQAALTQQLAEEKTLTAKLAEARQKVEAQLAAKTKALQGKEAQLAQLQKEERARQAALAAAAKKAAQEAAAKAAREKAAKEKATEAATTSTVRRAGVATPHEGGSAGSTDQHGAGTGGSPATDSLAADPSASGTPSADTDTGSSGTAAELRAEVVNIALSYLGAPYHWAGATPGGFDCSGFVLYVFGKVGVSLPHSSAMQYGVGRHVAKSDLLPGDLVFFYSPISHVGIYIGNGQMVNSRGSGVQIDSAFWSSYVGAARVLE